MFTLKIIKANCLSELSRNTWIVECKQIERNIRVQKAVDGLKHYWYELKDTRFNRTKEIIEKMLSEDNSEQEIDKYIPENSIISTDINYGLLPSAIFNKIKEEIGIVGFDVSSGSIISTSIPMGLQL